MSSDRGDTGRRHLPQKGWRAGQDASVRDILGRTVGFQQTTVEKTVANCVPIMTGTPQYFLERSLREARGLQPRTNRILPKQDPSTLLLREKGEKDGNRR